MLSHSVTLTHSHIVACTLTLFHAHTHKHSLTHSLTHLLSRTLTQLLSLSVQFTHLT
eukprot:m.151279 g.151279  ORF g.151279 m.151279 type:complete len:57 (-) comp14247_c0_seq7:289-459(-)